MFPGDAGKVSPHLAALRRKSGLGEWMDGSRILQIAIGNFKGINVVHNKLHKGLKNEMIVISVS